MRRRHIDLPPRLLARFLLLLLPAAAGPACSSPGTPVPGGAEEAPAAATGSMPLPETLDQILSDRRLSGAMVAARVIRAEDGGEIYSRNADILLLPASNLKVVTAVAALDVLGPDHVFETELSAAGSLRAPTLEGHLVVTGGGDPSLGPALSGTAEASLFDAFAAALRDRGITTVTGDIVGDDDLFDDVAWGQGWPWDDMTEPWSVPISALTLHDGTVTLLVHRREGDAGGPRVERSPVSDLGRIVTSFAPPGDGAPAGARLRAGRREGSDDLYIEGPLPPEGARETLTVAVRNPTLHFAAALRCALRERGIDVRGRAIDIDDLTPGEREALRRSGKQRLASHASAPLREILRVFLKRSQNNYGEMLARALAAEGGAPRTFEAGRSRIERVLEDLGVASHPHRLADGSGLSRMNLLSARFLTELLRAVRATANFRDFLPALPVAGRDGTLAGRMRGSAAEGRVSAKTGTLTSVKALSGYVETVSGDVLIFSILMNGFLAPERVAVEVQDAFCAALAAEGGGQP